MQDAAARIKHAFQECNTNVMTAVFAGFNGLQNVGSKTPTLKTNKQKTLDNIHWYLRIIVVLNALFVLTVVASILVTYFSLQHYDAMNRENINAIITNVVGITSNANTASAFAVPITADVAFSTNQLASAFGRALNSSSTQIPLDENATETMLVEAAQRHLLHYDEQDVSDFTVNTQRAIFKLTRSLLQTVQTKVEEFNPGAVSDLLAWLVADVQYGEIAKRFDRIMNDVEKTAHFGVLASAMLGIAATATNTTLPSPSDLLNMYTQQKAAASTGGGGSCA
jgi:hypothetical protein